MYVLRVLKNMYLKNIYIIQLELEKGFNHTAIQKAYT